MNTERRISAVQSKKVTMNFGLVMISWISFLMMSLSIYDSYVPAEIYLALGHLSYEPITRYVLVYENNFR